eukprot:3815718-Pyramimonas_sp.AAC.1
MAANQRQRSRRTRALRAAGVADGGGVVNAVDAAKLIPKIFQKDIAKVRDDWGMSAIDFKETKPGDGLVGPHRLHSMNDTTGDMIAYGIIMLALPGEVYS